MWNWLKCFLGLEITAKDIERERNKGTIILTGKEVRVTEPITIPSTPEPEKEWNWPSSLDIRTRRKPSLLELSKRRNPSPSSTERKMPKSFANRPGVKQAQVNLGKVGYDPKAKIEEDPPRRRRW